MKREKDGVSSVKTSSMYSVPSVLIWSRMDMRTRALVDRKILEKGDIIEPLTFSVFLEDKEITIKDD